MAHEEFAAKHPHPPSPVYVKIDRHSNPVIDRHQETAIDRQPPEPIDRRAPLTWADDRYHESYAVETSYRDKGADELHETSFRRLMEQTNSSCNNTTFQNNNRRLQRSSMTQLEEKDEINRGYTRHVDGHTIRVHNKDIRRLLERASRDEPNYICLLEHDSSFTKTKLVPEIYTKDEINEIFYGVCGEQENNKRDFQMKLDGVYYPLNDSIS
ncbi:hypothetical protein F2Q68_00034423 [Brassica cretica]|uniref:Uncharacterized protein n=1 Tax=Brassica cretica TaxID=69181 RepID=A0A8S9H064_BRACR|nr:hypothetical protein F2Q68_00034423 [Brassica cretica]